jgi:hypothetical protein
MSKEDIERLLTKGTLHLQKVNYIPIYSPSEGKVKAEVRVLRMEKK